MKKLLMFSLLMISFSQFAQNITRIEYWIDGDPGHGLATNLPINNPSPNVQNVIRNSILSLNPGMHIMGIRSKDASGRWSQTNHIPFSISDVAPQSNIVAIAFFWDGDAGFDSNQQIILSEATANITDYQFLAAAPALFSDTNPHRLFCRTIDNHGVFSHTNLVENVTLETEDFQKSGIRFYPNPIVSDLNIEMENNEKSRLILYDINGKVIVDTVVSGNSKIDFSHLNTGIYTAYFWKSRNQIYVKKLIKK